MVNRERPQDEMATEKEQQKQLFCALCLKTDVGTLDDDCHCVSCIKTLEELEKYLAAHACDGCEKPIAICECLTEECQYCFTEYRIIDGVGSFCSRYCLNAMNGISCYCCYDD